MWTPEDRALVGDYGSGQALTDDQWRLLQPLIPPAKPGGRPRTTDMRHLLDSLFYVLRTGCQWRHLPPPPAFLPRSTVYGYLRAFLSAGVWESMRHHLVVLLREGAGREPSPTATIIDSQSVKTTEAGGPRGYDAAKKVMGRKRRIAVDTQGLLLGVVVHAASVQDGDGAGGLLGRIKPLYCWLRAVFADGVYNRVPALLACFLLGLVLIIVTREPAFGASPQHLAAATRPLRFIWVPIESGAPAVDPYRPFGSPDPWTDLAALAGTADEAALRGLYCGIMNELPTFVRAAAAKLAPGRYALDAESAARLRGFMPSDNPGVVGDDGFEYTAEHAAVLPRMAWRFCDAQGELGWDPFKPEQIEPTEDEWLLEEGGDPRTWPVMAVSDKRPYGERSYFELDMADALGIPQSGGEGGEPLPEAVLAQLGALHHTVAAALRVVVLHGKA